jgi:hypothetical protein
MWAASFRRLIADFPQRRPGFGQVGFVVNKMALGHVFSKYFGFPYKSSLHEILHPNNHPGQVQQARSSRRAEWTQIGHPLPCEFKKKNNIERLQTFEFGAITMLLNMGY